MEDSEDKSENIASKTDLIELQNKIDDLSSIMEKFGLDLISKLGQVTFNLKILTDKVEKLSQATIDVKSLSPQFSKVLENQEYLESEIDLLKSLIQKISKLKSNNSIEESSIEKTPIITGKKISINEDLKDLKILIEEEESIAQVIEKLNGIKETIFEFSGGSRLSYDIAKIIKQLEKTENLSASLKSKILEKISYWKENL
ncbi:MAG: hypothetical protein P8Y70_15105 [Candidatus Lokiarchaeota archaeon]